MDKNVAKIVDGIIKYLNSSQQIPLLPDVITALQIKAQQLNAQSKAFVTSSYKLSPKEMAQITEALWMIFKKKLVVINVVDPSLIGGLKITVEDKIIDLSLDKTLSSLKNKIDHD